MRAHYRRYRRTWYGQWRRGLYPWTVIVLPWGSYERCAHLFWRIRVPLWLAGAGAGWALAGPAGLACGLAAAYLTEGLFSYRTASNATPIPVAAGPTDADFAAVRARARRWEAEAVPSPGGWQPPDGVLPGWSWAPRGGLSPRLDRVPAWVRLWYKAPLVDRYAHAWMWSHGGWDVQPPRAAPDVSET
jgi:hypothetical protein